MRKLLLLLLCFLMAAGTALAEPIPLDVRFPATLNSETLSREAVFDDAWFAEPSSVYNHQLTKLSICMAVASFRDTLADLLNSDHYLKDFFAQAGFELYQGYGYDVAPGADTISSAVAMKRMADAQGEYILLAVPVCGQGYGDEWMSNFTMDAGDTHSGFLQAAETVVQRLKAYIGENGLTGQRIKVWGSGFSRAAAVSNLVGHLLLNDPDFEPDNIFIYTFGTPNTTKKPAAYPQIFNICGGFDPVPKIPFPDWGYGKHGSTLYLPALETTARYADEVPLASSVYHALMGQSDDFASLSERNWLVGQLLELLYEFIPESAVYSEAYQAAVVAAVGNKGNLLDKLNAMLRALDEYQEDISGMAQVRDELMTLLSMGVTDTVNMLTGNGGTSVWYDLLSSGMLLAHEHFPEMYLSWVFSTDDTDLLYGQSTRFGRLVITGDVDVRVIDADTEEMLLDSKMSALSVTRLNEQMFIALPSGKNFRAIMRAKGNTRVNVAFSNASVNRVSIPLGAINPVTLHPNESVTVDITVRPGGEAAPTVLLNGTQALTVFSGEKGGTYAQLLLERGAAITEEMRYMVNSAVIMGPWLLCSTTLVLYALAIFIKRLIRRVDDLTECRRKGRIVLLIAAGMAAVTAINQLFMVLTEVHSVEAVVLTNPTLQRAAELLGVSTYAYQASQIVVYVCMALLCVRAIRHEFSRIRLFRLSSVLLLLDVMTIFLGRVFATTTPAEFLAQLLPILAITGLAVSISREDPRRMVGKRWLPVSRAAFATAAIFFARQAYVLIFGTQTVIAVGLKALSGLPVVLLALLVWRRRGTHENKMTLAAICCYFAANTVINLSMPLALIVYTAGHGLLTWAYLRGRKLSKRRFTVWAVLSVLFILQLFLLQTEMAAMAKALAVVYIAAVTGVLVTAQMVSRRVQLGSILFLVSNQILSFTLMFPGDFLLESVELLLYYIAVIILVSDPDALNVPADLYSTQTQNT